MLKLLSSNESKLKEFNEYGMPVALERGRDIREVLADPITVVLYKALEAGADCIVEDTSLEVDNSDIGVDIKFRVSELQEHVGSRATATVLLAHNDGRHIYVYRGVSYGVITKPKDFGDAPVFGFDNHFTPLESNYNLHELKCIRGLWHRVPRYRAVRNFKEGHCMIKQDVGLMSEWNGEYQTE